MTFDAENTPHYRVDPLTGDRVLVSPHRAKRPWQGAIEGVVPAKRVRHDPGCPLCPGVARANGSVNPAYEGTFVFENDFPALLPDRFEIGETAELYQIEPVAGECRVICFSPRHDLTLAEFEVSELEGVVQLWKVQTDEMLGRWEWVQIFENKGEMMGCSNPHPHGQIWATSVLPSRIETMASRQRDWLATHERPMLAEIVETELREGVRVIEANADWVAFVPFWAVWPYEVMLAPRRFAGRLTELSRAEEQALAELLSRVLRRLDGLFQTSFPYSFGWRQEPASGSLGWGLHGHILPPLLRSATVRKFMVGFELLSGPQRDLTPEQAAERLRAVRV